jgi:hypothetical protein
MKTSVSPAYSAISHRSMRTPAKLMIFGWLLIAGIAMARLIVLLVRWFIVCHNPTKGTI